MIFPGFPGVLSFFQVFQVEWEPCLFYLEFTVLTWWLILFRNKLFTHLKQSMCAAGLHLYSPALSFAKPISWNMSSPWKAALDSTKGLNVRNIVYDRLMGIFYCDFFLSFFLGLVFNVSNNSSWGKYQSKLSPLYVENKFGFISRIWSKNFWRRDIWKENIMTQSSEMLSRSVSHKWRPVPNFDSSCNFTSSGSLNTMNGPSNSGLGVYSKSSISCEIISLLHIK